MNSNDQAGVLRSPLLWIAIACVACLAPFLGKAFHIDDTLFVWNGQWIAQHPLDFYGKRVNWEGTEARMSTITKNPPLACYALAVAGSVLGWSEPALHLAFLAWPLGALWGTYRLAERLSERPALAALATALTPVFLVSSTSVMCDTMMLCLWVWAVVWWVRGLDRSEPRLLVLSGLLIGLAALTKYYAICLAPLLLLYTFARRQNLAWAAGALVLPGIILAVYQVYTVRQYGHGLLSDAFAYSGQIHDFFQKLGWELPRALQIVVGVAFTGGCLACVLFYLPFVWPRGAGLLLFAAVVLVQMAVFAWGESTSAPGSRSGQSLLPSWNGFQGFIWAAVGVCVLALAVVDLWRERSADSLLLFAWVIGTYLFAAFLNWTLNGRSILPMTPAVGILLARALTRTSPDGGPLPWKLAVPLLPAAALALAVAWADHQAAGAARTAADLLRDRYAKGPGTAWFQGHWGFQYYMERWGARPFDQRVLREEKQHRLKPGDWFIMPRHVHNTYIWGLWPKAQRGGTIEHLGVPTCPWGATMNKTVGAGFYSELGFGRLPFSFDAVPPDAYKIVQLDSSQIP
jgi:hypothetical protein